MPAVALRNLFTPESGTLVLRKYPKTSDSASVFSNKVLMTAAVCCAVCVCSFFWAIRLSNAVEAEEPFVRVVALLQLNTITSCQSVCVALKQIAKVGDKKLVKRRVKKNESRKNQDCQIE